MSNLFSYGDVKTRPARSGFDLGKRFCFTSKAGELLPVYWQFVNPNEKYRIRWQHVSRTAPVATAAFVRLREYFDWYFVPLRLINKNLLPAVVQMEQNSMIASSVSSNKQVTTDIPWTYSSGESTQGTCGLWNLICYADASENLTNVTVSIPTGITNFFGFFERACSLKLLQYLGYGNFFPTSSTPLGSNAGLSSNPDFSLVSKFAFEANVLPLAAYQKIYMDHFRDSQWEENQAYCYNFDWYTGGNVFASITSASLCQSYMKSPNLLTLRYANYNKDLFTGLLPNSQVGDPAAVSTEGGADGIYLLRWNNGSPSPNNSDVVTGATSGDTTVRNLTLSVSSQEGSPGNGSVYINIPSTDQASFSVLQLRIAEAMQRWKEVTQCNDQTYYDQIKAHFGVTPNAALSDICRWLGGSAHNLDITEVVNTNLATSDDSADIKGKGYGSGQGFLDFSSGGEYGILMCIYHNQPLLDYVLSGQPRQLLYTNTLDLPKPEFDSIGLEPVYWTEFMNNTGWPVSSKVDTIMGYAPRYYDLKTAVDTVTGAFTTTLQDWVAPVSSQLGAWFDSLLFASAFDYNFVFRKVCPSVLDSIFGVKADSTWDTDQFRTSAFFDVKAVRPFDYDGMPY